VPDPAVIVAEGPSAVMPLKPPVEHRAEPGLDHPAGGLSFFAYLP
jgi:hypothetical protein